MDQQVTKQNSKSETQNHEPTDLSTAVKSSLKGFQNETPKTIETKEEAHGQLHLIQAKRSQMKTIYNHIHSIGADKQLLSEKKERNQMLFNKWFQTLVVQNSRFPTDIPVEFVLEEFFDAILQQKVEVKGFNLLAHMSAFHEYLDDYEHELRGKWWRHQNPDQRPNALPERGTVDEAEQQQSDEQRAKMLKRMYGAENVPEHLQKFITE